MADHYVTVNYESGVVSCDPDTVDVQDNQTVQWQAGNGVLSISSIDFASDSYFSALPNTNNSWTGTVAGNATGDDTYTVWVNTSDGLKKHDPKLHVDQPPGS